MQRSNTKEIIEDLNKFIKDDKMIAKYGTSVTAFMGNDYQKQLEATYHRLVEEFKEINKNSSDGINMDEMLEFINKNSKKVYC